MGRTKAEPRRLMLRGALPVRLEQRLDDGAPDSVGGERADLPSVQQLGDLPRALTDLRPLVRSALELRPVTRDRERAPRLRAQGVPGLGPDEVVAHESAIRS